jgi:hypothetical protein
MVPRETGLAQAMVDLWCESHRRPPKAITLDIDDTADTVHGHQQLSLFNAHHDERCFMPVHVYDADTGHCVLTVLRPGKTPDGKEVRAHLRRLVRRIRRRAASKFKPLVLGQNQTNADRPLPYPTESPLPRRRRTSETRSV